MSENVGTELTGQQWLLVKRNNDKAYHYRRHQARPMSPGRRDALNKLDREMRALKAKLVADGVELKLVSRDGTIISAVRAR